MKKFISLLLAFCFIFIFCSCQKAADDTTTEPASAESDAAENGSADSNEKKEGLLYAVSSDGSEDKTTVFSFMGGDYTPERIAAGFSGWTGLKFRISSETDEENKKISITWLEESSFYAGNPDNGDNPNFSFSDSKEMRTFMLNSLYKTIIENMGDYEVYYSLENGDINNLGLDAEFSSSQPFALI